MVKVVIDPGHGGPSNPPKVGGSSWNNATGPTGLLEKTVTLQVAKAVLATFDGTGINVILTRSTDVNLGITARAKVAKDARAEVFVSIHFNAAPATSAPAQGTETWIGNDPIEKSKQLAGFVQRSVCAATGLRDRGVKTGNVSGVIKNEHHHAKTAHCLVEISFLDRQPAEEARLRTADYIKKLGNAVRDGVLRYLQSAGLLEGEEHEMALLELAEPGDAIEAYASGLVYFDAPTPGVPLAVPEVRPTTEAVSYQRFQKTDTAPARPSSGITQDVPLIGDRTSNRSFTDISNRSSVDSPESVLRGFAEATRLEAEVKGWNTVQASLLGSLGKAAQAVARIAVPAGNYNDFRGRPALGAWHGTGFLVADNLLLTNHHVLNSPEVAKAAVAEFGYEVTAEDLIEGKMDGTRPIKKFKFDPQRLFVTSPATSESLDYTFVWIEEVAAREYGCIKMERASFTAERFDPVFVIHHPRGRLKEASLDDTEVLRMRSTVIHYAADTDQGSSGSPVFDRNGRLIALHHASNSDQPEQLQDGRITEVVNEGIKISAIAIDLENRVRRGDPDARMAQIVLHSMIGSDTLTGFFGALGRESKGNNAVEAVVNAYTGTEQDVDIGFWNIEWLATRYTDKTKLEGAATVIVDLNLDIWCLSEVSALSIQELVKTLHEKFGENYQYAFSEPITDSAKQSTAVIWKPRLVTGEALEWPSPINKWWRLDSRDKLPFEAIDGQIFNRYPGLLRFSVSGREGLAPFDFLLVPLHLKAMAEGSKRRRLASILLARAIEHLKKTGWDSDWIVGGDVNEELSSGDFDALTKAGMIAMSATDEEAGAFTYLKSPKSLIDNIFLSPNISTTIGSTDYFIVAKEQSMDKFVKRVSDHRPVVLRLSIADGTARMTGNEAGLQNLADQIIRDSEKTKGNGPKPSAKKRKARKKAPRARAAKRS